MGQHYVPQFYLKNFANKSGDGFSIPTFFKEDQKICRTNIKNIAQEIGFYDIPEDGFSAEPLLADLENCFKVRLNNLLLNPDISDLSEDEKSDLALFIALQMNRTPVSRDVIDQTARLFNNITGKQEENALKVKKVISKSHIKLMLELSVLMHDLLLRLDWHLLKSPDNEDFWTSDNPVYRFNEPNPGFYGNLGLISPGIQIIFPISPKYLLLLLDGKNYTPLPALIPSNHENLLFYNSGQVIHSKRMVFSKRGDFEMAKKFLNEHPQFGEINRKRMSTT